MTDHQAKNRSQEKSEEASKKSSSHSSTLMFSQHFRVSLMVAAISVSMIGLFAGGGYLLDQQFQTKPLFLLAGVILSFPLSQFAVYRWVKKSYVPKITSKNS